MFGSTLIRWALIVCSVAVWFSSTHKCPMPRGNGCCCIAQRVCVFFDVFAVSVCVCVCVCGWVEFRCDVLACWLGVLSPAHTEPLGIRVGCCSLQRLASCIFLSLSHIFTHTHSMYTHVCAWCIYRNTLCCTTKCMNIQHTSS